MPRGRKPIREKEQTVTTGFSLWPSVIDDLDEIAAVEKVTRGEILRRAIIRYIEQYRQQA